MSNWRLLAVALALSFDAHDAWAFRCGHELVQVGDHKLDVLDKCGEPDAMQERTAIRGSRLRHPYGVLQIDDHEEVLIEEWVYNFGPRKFKQFLRFEDGILVSIRPLRHGY